MLYIYIFIYIYIYSNRNKSKTSVNQITFEILKREHRISGHISVHRQQGQTPDHLLQKTN